MGRKKNKKKQNKREIEQPKKNVIDEKKDIGKKEMDNQETKSLLATSLGFIGLIAGGMAAISAVLAALGFLVVRGYTEKLGISNFASYSTTEYVYEGALFLHASFKDLVVNIGPYLFFTIGITFIVLYLISVISEKKYNKENYLFELTEKYKKPKWRISLLAFFSTFSLLYIAYVVYKVFPEQNTGILYSGMLSENNSSKLYYNNLFIFILVLIVGVFFVKQDKKVKQSISTKLLTDKERTVEYLYNNLRVVACISFLILLSTWATHYGRSSRPRYFQQIIAFEIPSDKELQTDIEHSKPWLVKENSDGFIVYLEKMKTVRWIPKSMISYIGVGDSYDISSNVIALREK